MMTVITKILAKHTHIFSFHLILFRSVHNFASLMMMVGTTVVVVSCLPYVIIILLSKYNVCSNIRKKTYNTYYMHII